MKYSILVILKVFICYEITVIYYYRKIDLVSNSGQNIKCC